MEEPCLSSFQQCISQTTNQDMTAPPSVLPALLHVLQCKQTILKNGVRASLLDKLCYDTIPYLTQVSFGAVIFSTKTKGPLYDICDGSLSASNIGHVFGKIFQTNCR